MRADERVPEGTGAAAGIEPENCRLTNRSAIAGVLRKMAAQGALLTDEWRQTLAMIGVHEDDHWLYLDDPSSEIQRQRLVNGRSIAFSGHDGKVRIRFMLERLTPVELKDGPALRAALPETLVRLQRREIFRQSLPARDRLAGCFMLRNGTPVHVAVVDLSIGGVALLEPESGPAVDWSPGTVYDEFRVQLPGLGKIVADIEIRNSFEADGHPGRRIGCRFLNLTRPQAVTIQRYIQRVDRLRRQRAWA